MKTKDRLKQIIEMQAGLAESVKGTDEHIAQLIGKLCDRMAALEVRINKLPDAVDRLPGAVGAAAPEEKKGLDALFDAGQKYRHVCTKAGCKHIAVNLKANGMSCSRCHSPMTSTPVKSDGRHWKVKRGSKIPAAKA